MNIEYVFSSKRWWALSVFTAICGIVAYLILVFRGG